MIEELFKKFNIKPKDEQIYIKSLTHSSYLNEHELIHEDFEKLEFMGDAVLQLLVTEIIYLQFRDFDEGELTLLRSKLVRTESLAKIAKDNGFGNYLFLGVGAERGGGRDKVSILADAFEAFIGATYLDQGYFKTKRLVKKIFSSAIKNVDMEDLVDYKSKLQKILINTQKGNITYELISKTGKSNDPTFEYGVLIEPNLFLGKGKGGSKKEAQQNAAKDALKKLAKQVKK